MRHNDHLSISPHPLPIDRNRDFHTYALPVGRAPAWSRIARHAHLGRNPRLHTTQRYRSFPFTVDGDKNLATQHQATSHSRIFDLRYFAAVPICDQTCWDSSDRLFLAAWQTIIVRSHRQFIGYIREAITDQLFKPTISSFVIFGPNNQVS